VGIHFDDSMQTLIEVDIPILCSKHCMHVLKREYRGVLSGFATPRYPPLDAACLGGVPASAWLQLGAALLFCSWIGKLCNEPYSWAG
jgi:hypothetical protein